VLTKDKVVPLSLALSSTPVTCTLTSSAKVDFAYAKHMICAKHMDVLLRKMLNDVNILGKGHAAVSPRTYVRGECNERGSSFLSSLWARALP
jgi:hypothetical protein